MSTDDETYAQIQDLEMCVSANTKEYICHPTQMVSSNIKSSCEATLLTSTSDSIPESCDVKLLQPTWKSGTRSTRTNGYTHSASSQRLLSYARNPDTESSLPAPQAYSGSIQDAGALHKLSRFLQGKGRVWSFHPEFRLLISLWIHAVTN
ncbi:hypothetical protein RUM44_002300 [Polyplax serrata]|uniref:Uncharacterized protein n=1 Tax=Polyplax serrata TaxID=468196 RepID=A0ABR1AP93_POLSC